ncbi:MAG: hypothetical protein IKI90_05255 [Treponema sp.]|nr:hypothetical protein [Treponema sp.]
MKKNVKVIIMKAKAPNGNNRTYRTMGSLEMTIADACKMRNIPMLSILSATVSAPMTEADAAAYMMNDYAAQVLAPNAMLVKATFSCIAA